LRGRWDVKSHATAAGKALVLAALLSLPPALLHSADPSFKPSASVQVLRVIGGDTIAVCCVGGKRENVRYIGVSTPEIHQTSRGIEPLGKEAAVANVKLVAAKTIHLEFDLEQRDRYGRLLAYVYLEDGTFVNAWLVQQGFGQVITTPPNVKYHELLLRLQGEAREAGRGLWR
jgi:micrococcal nuclease